MAPPSGVAKIITITNVGKSSGDLNDSGFHLGYNIFIRHNNADSTPNNRIILRAAQSLRLTVGDSIRLWYDHISNRWRTFGLYTYS